MSDLDLDFTITPTKRDLPQNSPSGAAQFLGGTDYHLAVTEAMVSGVRRQAGTSPTREIGGVLVGKHYRTDDQYVVHVQDFIPVPSDDSGVAHFAFDESSIRAILTGLAAQPDKYVVGWYHSHVGGEPFMSEMDVTLHSSHFPEPWHVSCVVSLGTRGRPMGFWRISGDRLTEIGDYSIAISTAGEFAESQELYLDACGLADPLTVPRSFSRIATLCGLADNPAIAKVMAEATATMGTFDALTDARFVVGAAAAAAEDPEVLPGLAVMAERLGRMVSFDDALTAVSSTPLSGDQISFHGGECYTYSRRSIHLKRFDLDLEVPLPVRVRAAPRSVAHGSDGHPWVLAGNGDMIRLPVVDMTRWLAGDHSFEVAAVEVPEIKNMLQVVPVGTRLWLRTATEWHGLDLTETEDAIAVTGHARGDLPARDGVFVPANGFTDPAAPPRLLAITEGVLELWTLTDGEWITAARHPLPLPWRGMRLRHAVQGGTGWHALLVDAETYLCVFDTHTLEFRHHVLVGVGEPLITGLSGNGAGLVYAKAGGVLFRA